MTNHMPNSAMTSTVTVVWQWLHWRQVPSKLIVWQCLRFIDRLDCTVHLDNKLIVWYIINLFDISLLNDETDQTSPCWQTAIWNMKFTQTTATFSLLRQKITEVCYISIKVKCQRHAINSKQDDSLKIFMNFSL